MDKSTILFVEERDLNDQEKLARRSLTKMLEEGGLKAIVAENPADAVQLLEEFEPEYCVFGAKGPCHRNEKTDMMKAISLACRSRTAPIVVTDNFEVFKLKADLPAWPQTGYSGYQDMLKEVAKFGVVRWVLKVQRENAAVAVTTGQIERVEAVMGQFANPTPVSLSSNNLPGRPAGRSSVMPLAGHVR